MATPPPAPKLTPEQLAYRKQLEAQVKSGAIKQSQLEAEMQRKLAEGNAPTTPGAATPAPRGLSQQMQQNKANLQAQVGIPGGISQAQADAELARLQGLEQTVRPTFGGVDVSTPQGTIQGQLDVNQDYINQQQGLGNLQNQQGPLGSRDLVQDPQTGRWVQKDTLSAGQQGVLTGLEGSGTAAGDMVTNLIKNGAFGSTMNAGEGTPASNYETSVFKQLTRGLDERKARDQQALDQSLTQRGLPVGSEAYQNAMREFEKGYSDQYADAQNKAVQGAADMQLKGIDTLSGVNQAGLKLPEHQQFSGAQGTNPDVSSIFATMVGKGLTEAQAAEATRQWNLQWDKQNSGGHGGSGRGSGSGNGGNRPPPTYNVPTPFSAGKPPGS
jgi:hypothetical protein